MTESMITERWIVWSRVVMCVDRSINSDLWLETELTWVVVVVW